MRICVKEQWALRHAALVAFAAAFGIRADGTPDPVVEGYISRQEELVADSQAIIARADAERRELSVEDRAAINNNTAEVERLQVEIEQRRLVTNQANRLREPQPRQTPANAGDPPPADNADQPPPAPQQQRPANRGTVVQTTHLPQARGNFTRDNHGFRNMGEFAHAVRRAAAGQGLDQRLQNAAATTYGNESTGADGGFAVPPEFRREIEALVMGEESLMSRCDANPTESNSVSVPTDETTAWGTTGVRAYWGAEAAAMSQSKPALKEHNTRLHKLHALVPLTEELMDDAPMAAALITRKAGEAINFKLTDAIVNGTGVGQPLGILNAPCLVTVSAEGSQTAGTIHAKNVAKMWARMPASARARSVWLANQDVESALMELGFQVGSPSGTMTGGMPLFVPPGGLSAQPYSTLLGRPVITTEACPTIGTPGDLVLAFLPGYFAPFKSGGVKNTVSMHLWFDQDLTAFKWTLRVGGQPWLQAAISRKSGSNTLSHFVNLAQR
jgi:HK97 family phage major capsid protein